VGFVPGLWLGAPAGARLARLRDYVAGGAGMALATLALYAARGDLAALWRAQVELPLALSGIASYATRFMSLWPPGELDLSPRVSSASTRRASTRPSSASA
jgi:hypothetical protein